MVDFLLKAIELKDETRAGWALRGVRNPESVADHSWGSALLCWLYAPSADAAGIDRERAVAMALLHDIAEAEMGDVATRVNDDERTMNAEEKIEREREAFGFMRSLLSGAATGAERRDTQRGRERSAQRDAEFSELWEEYEAAESATARFVRDMNLCDMCLQALYYERNRRYDAASNSTAFRRFERLDEFFETSRPRISSEIGRELFREIEARYRAYRDGV